MRIVHLVDLENRSGMWCRNLSRLPPLVLNPDESLLKMTLASAAANEMD